MKRKQIISIVVVVVFVAGLALVTRLANPDIRVFVVEGTITWLNAAERKMSIQYTSPRKRKLREKTADVPEDCEIILDGKPASLGDLKAGDLIELKVEYQKSTKKLRPIWGKVNRSAKAAATKPSS